MTQFLLHVLGITNANGKAYLFWSGVGGDILTMLPITTGVVFWYRHHKCHNCFRLGHHVPHYHFPVCRKHQQVLSKQSVNYSGAIYG